MTPLAPPRTAVPTVLVLRRAIAAEWGRLWTVRSTWWALLASLGIAVAMGATFGADTAGDEIPVWVAGQFTMLPAQFPLLVVALLPVTADHATGAIRSSLQWVPRRGVLLAARTTVAVVVATAAGVLTALVADLTAWAWLRGGFVMADVAASLVDVAVVVGAGALVTVALGTILRTTAGALTSVFLLLLVLPMALPEFGVEWLATVGRNLPGIAVELLEGMDSADSTGRILGVLGVWIVATTAAGAWLFQRRDAG